MKTTTIQGITRANWGAWLEATARRVVPIIALAYVAGIAVGAFVHGLNEGLAALVREPRREAVQDAPVAVAEALPAMAAPIAGAIAPAAPAVRPVRAAEAVTLAQLTNRELMQLVGTRRRLPKTQLIAMAVQMA
jgi:hypothetical protein